jgi:hypothetical protein
VPAKVEGEWKLPQGQLSLKQEFQKVSGTLNAGGKSVPITNGILRGAQIEFTAGDSQFSGRVSDTLMQGSFKTGSRGGSWSATRAQ